MAIDEPEFVGVVDSQFASFVVKTDPVGPGTRAFSARRRFYRRHGNGNGPDFCSGTDFSEPQKPESMQATPVRH